MIAICDIFCWFLAKKKSIWGNWINFNHGKNGHKIRFSHVITHFTTSVTMIEIPVPIGVVSQGQLLCIFKICIQYKIGYKMP